MSDYKIIVIGASHGGVVALETIVAGLPVDLNAAIFVTLHIGSSSRSSLPEILNRAGSLPVAWACHAEPIFPGRIYVAPPDQHMLVARGYVRTVHGPKENHTRPAVDPLFRSAALTYGADVIGVILTGNLDNGTAGLLAIKDCGGITIVQDPAEALAPSMPLNALRHVAIDHCLPLDEIGAFLMTATAREAADPDPPPPSADNHSIMRLFMIENEFADASRVPHDRLEEIGIASTLTCPECRSVLYKIRDERALRFRCQLGHAFSAKTLLQDLAAAREDALWFAVRAVFEEAELARCLVQDSGSRDTHLARFLSELADRAEAQIGQLRKVIASISDLIEPDHLEATTVDLPRRDVDVA
jgi:two-component system chemotaxis response regulator CheB